MVKVQYFGCKTLREETTRKT